VRRRRPLHLLEVGVRWPPETFLCWKFEGLAAQGMHVTVASRTVFDPDARVPGVKLVEVPGRAGSVAAMRRAVRRGCLALLVRSPRRLARLLRSVRRAPAATQERYGGGWGLLAMFLPLARLRPDIVHFEWNTTGVTHLPMFDVWDCPVVVSCHGSQVTATPLSPDMGHYAERLPELMRRASLVHCVSDSLRREVVGLGVDPAKARVIRQGVDPEVFRPANGRTPPDGDFRVVAVGWMTWVKGYEYALMAIRALVDAGVPVRFEILGDHPEGADAGEPARIRHTVADLGLAEHVRLTGAVPSGEVARRLAQCDVLLHSSVDEGLPTVLLEAMACGVPVVAADCGGVSEAFEDGVEGFLVPPRDPVRLAAALLELWRSPELRARMGEAGRATATARFTLERHVSEFLALYREVGAA
jgi:glycosyltransferase involved in cell wall biosynthesis